MHVIIPEESCVLSITGIKRTVMDCDSRQSPSRQSSDGLGDRPRQITCARNSETTRNNWKEGEQSAGDLRPHTHSRKQTYYISSPISSLRVRQESHSRHLYQSIRPAIGSAFSRVSIYQKQVFARSISAGIFLNCEKIPPPALLGTFAARVPLVFVQGFSPVRWLRFLASRQGWQCLDFEPLASGNSLLRAMDFKDPSQRCFHCHQPSV